MKIDRLDAHDRLIHLKQDQWGLISQGAEDCLKRNPDALEIQNFLPYIYIFAHPRTADDGVSKRLFWQPRISRPKPQPNSFCFRAQSKTDIVEICWLLPPKEMWGQYKKGNVTESDIVSWSIHQFVNKFAELEAPHPDDWSEDQIKSRLQFKRI